MLLFEHWPLFPVSSGDVSDILYTKSSGLIIVPVLRMDLFDCHAGQPWMQEIYCTVQQCSYWISVVYLKEQESILMPKFSWECMIEYDHQSLCDHTKRLVVTKYIFIRLKRYFSVKAVTEKHRLRFETSTFSDKNVGSKNLTCSGRLKDSVAPLTQAYSP